ncbi:hypothetical protein DFQ28_004823 [Apophysomyces sp. BC1034]|nr:hypothetical protein DFQ28_004823 [Apophysomyces sp. BC1034]
MAAATLNQSPQLAIDPQTILPNGTESLDGNKPVVGIIYPPPDIRKFADKAAEHLAHKGPHLEEHIRENERHNPKFCFLNPNDPYHAYYQFKLKEAREGKTTATPKKQDVKDEQPEQQPEETFKLKEPESFEFSAPMPAMSAQDLDIMKLTAQFAARNGRQFISQLAQRESRNYQFDFLRPSHSLFPYFTELVKQYTKVLAPPKDLKDKLHKNIINKYRILDRVNERVEWVAWVKAEQKKKEDEDEKEKLAYASIDWHDFIIVETIEFTDADEQADLQPPVSLSELENMSLAQKRMASMPEPVQEEKPGDMEMDIEDVDMEEEEEEEEEEVPVARPAVQQAKVPDTNTPIKIRTDYKPKIFGSSSKTNEPTQICPRCGEAIPVSEMDEHMRIELLDPKWKEQKLAMEAKMKDSNLLQEGTDVAKILKNFSGYRSDIFGTEETEIGKKIAEEQEEAKKKERVIWDGHTATINLATQRAAQNMSIEEQIAAIHRSKGFAADQIGPHIPSASNAEPSAVYSAQQQQSYYNAPPHTGSPAIPDGSNLFTNQLPGMYNMQHPVPDHGAMVRKPEDDMEEHPEAKRARFENPMPTENNQWVAQPGTISLTIQTPEMPDKPEWNLTGSAVTVTDIYPAALISTVKDRIAAQLGMPVGKQKLSTMTGTVMKNSNNLQFYGLEDTADENSDMDELDHVLGNSDIEADDMSFDSECIGKMSKKAYEVDHVVHSMDNLLNMQKKEIGQVSSILTLTDENAKTLLRHFRWNKERMFERYMESPDKVLQSAGVVLNNSINLLLLAKNLSQPSFMCIICCNDDPEMETVSVSCNHRFCRDCYQRYLTQKICEEGDIRRIECPQDHCTLVVDAKTVNLLVDNKTNSKYQTLLNGTYVDDNDFLRWCPAPDCEYAIECHIPNTMLTTIAPTPIVCSLVKKWLKKCEEDSETASWIFTHTKECPGCQSTIEKNGGCNHMTCKKCRHEFCWVCMGPWSSHITTWYSCNRYETNGNTDDSKANSHASLKRAVIVRILVRFGLAHAFIQYYNRFTNHEQSAQLDKDLYHATEKKMETMQQSSDLSWIEVQFLKHAVDVTVQCRMTLKWTYAFAFYLPKTNDTYMLEDNQRDLEVATEQLSELLQQPLETEKIAQLRQAVLDKSVYVKRRREVLLEDAAKASRRPYPRHSILWGVLSVVPKPLIPALFLLLAATMVKVFLDIAIGNIQAFEEQKARYEDAKRWVTQWGSAYGFPGDDLEKFVSSSRDTLRDILINDPSTQSFRVEPPVPLGGGRLEIELFDKECPKTCDNFRAICVGGKVGKNSKKPLHFKNTKLFRLVTNFMVQGGDVTRGDGSGGESIYNGSFNDEKPGLAKKFTKQGLVAMANSGKNSNTSQFFITLVDASTNPKVFDKANGKYVIFGQVIDGLEVLQAINEVPVTKEQPNLDITVRDCGELDAMTITDTSVVLMAAVHIKTGGIGYQQDLPWNIPAEWQYFERITTKSYGSASMPAQQDKDTWHNVIITGRKSWESTPMNSQPLANRFNIVLSRDHSLRQAVESFPNSAFATSLDEAMAHAARLPGRTFILGGSKVYEAALERSECTHLLLTHVHGDHIVCDVFMPPIDMDLFRLATHEELQEFVQESVPRGMQEHGNIRYEFFLYLRRQ